MCFIPSTPEERCRAKKPQQQLQKGLETRLQQPLKSSSVLFPKDEFEIGELHMSKCARIHGVVTSISPMKLSASGKSQYFDGELSRKVLILK